jgi:hypothetical protein
MSDHDEIKRLIEALDPWGRATVAYLAAVRLADICADERFAEHFSWGPQMFPQAMEACHALATGRPPRVDMKILQQEFAELLGVGELDYEEPEGPGVWFEGGLVAAYYAVGAWAQPHDSARWCNDATLCLHSSVDFLSRELRDSRPAPVVAGPSGADLLQIELDRERDDLVAVDRLADPDRSTVVGELVAASQELGRRYRAAFDLVTVP